MAFSPGGLRVRPVEHSNISDLIRLAEETNLSPWSHDDLLAEIGIPEGILLRLVSLENEFLGFIVGRIVPGSKDQCGPDAEIYNVAIRPTYQGTGLGQILLDAFLDECRSRSAANVWLEVREGNMQAVKFYEKNDFRHIQTRPSFYQDPVEDALLMQLSLKNETA